MSDLRPTVLTISLARVAENFRRAREIAGEGTEIMAVVKADAYGHGLVPVARRLEKEGCAALAVATVDEGVALREAGVRLPVLILGACTAQGLREAAWQNLTPSLWEGQGLKVLEAAAARLDRPVQAHLKIDTGMARLGARGKGELERLLDAWKDAPHVNMQAMFTHFADAGDREYTDLQNRRFLEAAEIVGRSGFRPLLHAAASEALILGGEYRHHMARPGIMLYGAAVTRMTGGLRPAQTLATRPARLTWIEAGETVGYGRAFRAERPTRVMTLPVGYGDGYPRILGGRAQALVEGRRAPVIGRVCMDQMMLDVTDVPGANMDSEVVLLGSQGNQTITPDELAELAGTIPYEIMLGFSARVTRRILD